MLSLGTEASASSGIASKHHLHHLVDLLINKHLPLDQLVQQTFPRWLTRILGQCLAARLSLLDSAVATMYGALSLRAVGHVPALHRGEVCLTRRQNQCGAPTARMRAQCKPTLPAIRQGLLFQIHHAVNDLAPEQVIVAEGDSLSKIAINRGIPVEAMIAANPQLADPTRLYPGDMVNLPKAGPSSAE